MTDTNKKCEVPAYDNANEQVDSCIQVEGTDPLKIFYQFLLHIEKNSINYKIQQMYTAIINLGDEA